MTPWVSLIRKAAKERTYKISKHAFQRMGELSVAEEYLEKCLLEGEPLEEQDHGWDLKVLLKSEDENHKEFYAVVALTQPTVIVTVCRFQEKAWDDLGPFKKRK